VIVFVVCRLALRGLYALFFFFFILALYFHLRFKQFCLFDFRFSNAGLEKLIN